MNRARRLTSPDVTRAKCSRAWTRCRQPQDNSGETRPSQSPKSRRARSARIAPRSSKSLGDAFKGAQLLVGQCGQVEGVTPVADDGRLAPQEPGLVDRHPECDRGVPQAGLLDLAGDGPGELVGDLGEALGQVLFFSVPKVRQRGVDAAVGPLLEGGARDAAVAGGLG